MSQAGTTEALIERDGELEAATGLLTRATAGAGGAVVVEGIAGLGKTTLVTAIAERAAADGFTVLTARCDVLERDFPHGVARQLFEPPLRAAGDARRAELLDGSAAVAGDLLLGGGSPGGDASLLVAHALYWLAWGLSTDAPLLLLVDDAHWADRPSARALLHLARRLDDCRIALIVTRRPGEPDAPAEIAEHLALEPGVQTIALQPLTAAGTAGLVRRHNPLADHALCERCHAAAGGNPLVARELARVTAEAGPDAIAGDGSLLPGAHAPVLERVVGRRLAALPATARSAVEAVAILGDDAAPAHVARVGDIDPAAVPAARDRLQVAGLLADGGALRFAHPIMRQAVLATIPASARAERHREAATLLQTAGADIDSIAAHLLLCDPAGDPWVVATLRAAAARAIDRGAPESAVAYLRRALAEPPTAGERPAVLVPLGTAEFDSGFPGSADRLREALVGLEDHAARVDVLSRLAALEVLRQGGDADAGLFERELEALGADDQLRLAAEVAAIDVMLMLPDRQEERQARVAALPPTPAVPSPYDRIALAHRAWVAAERGDAPAAATRRLAREALSGDGLLDVSLHRPSYHLACRALVVADAFDDAAAALDRLHERATRAGSLAMRAAVGWYRADLHLRTGHVADAENEARLVIELHEHRDQVLGGAVEALVNALVERDALDEADAVLREHGWDGPIGEGYLEIGMRIARARLALARGDADAALADALDCGRLRTRQGRPNPAWTPWRSTAALARLLAGDRDGARADADAEVALARVYGSGRALGIALRVRALAAAEPGEALTLLFEALTVLQDSGAVLERARVLADFGRTLRRMGDLHTARDPLRRAHADADRLGATALAARTREELVAAGLRPRRAQTSGVASLTPRQRRVCELAAAGRTNRAIAQELFVSVKTVETHLAAAYRKLEVGSKADLEAALRAG